MRRALILSLAVMASCAGPKEPSTDRRALAGALATGAIGAQLSPRDSLVDSLYWDTTLEVDSLLTGEDTTVARVNALADSLKAEPNGARAPAWLWTLGRLTRRAHGQFDEFKTKPPFVAAHPEQFWPEPVNAYYYNGYHYHELIRRFPGDSLALLAELALNHVVTEGECEGNANCALVLQAMGFERFARLHPRSPYAERALRRAVATFDLMLVPRKRNPFTVEDSAEVRSMIARLDSTVTSASIPVPVRRFANETLHTLWATWGNTKRAAEIDLWLKAHPKD
jgi:hypothetical protein